MGTGDLHQNYIKRLRELADNIKQFCVQSEIHTTLHAKAGVPSKEHLEREWIRLTEYVRHFQELLTAVEKIEQQAAGEDDD